MLIGLLVQFCVTWTNMADSLEKHLPFRQKQTVCIIIKVFFVGKTLVAEPELSTRFGWDSRLIPRDLAYYPQRLCHLGQWPSSLSLTPTQTSLLIHKVDNSFVFCQVVVIISCMDYVPSYNTPDMDYVPSYNKPDMD